MKSTASRLMIGLALVCTVSAVAPAHAEWNKGLEAYNNKDYATAAAEFEEVTKTNPDYVGGYYMLGLCQRAQNNLSQALGNLRKAVELDSANEKPDPRYRIALAQGLNQSKQYGDAYSTLKPLELGQLPASYRTSYALLFAQAANKTNRSGEAVNVLNAQIRADSSNASLYQALGVAENALGDDRKAFDAFKRAFELNSRDEASGRNAARAAIAVARRASSSSEKTRYYTQGAQIVERLVAVDPSFEHHLLAGEAWLGAGEYAKALSWFEKAKSQQLNNALVYYYIAQCNTSLNRLDTAVGSLQKSLELGSSNSDLRKKIYNQMGYVYEKKKDFTRAKQNYLEAGNRSKAAEMDTKATTAAENVEHEKACREFKLKIDALDLQADEFEKLGDVESANQLREQSTVLQRQYSETCG
jgi:tetratricopeptide (TPR) repeat protein